MATHWTHPALAHNDNKKDRDKRLAIEQRLNARLALLASSGALPQRLRHAHQVATALMDLCVLFDWPSKLCLSLVQDDALWDAFLLPAKAPQFQRDGAMDLARPQGVSLRPPVSGRLLASVVATLLRLGKHARAQEVLDACPDPKNQRVVLKRLLTQPDDPLRLLKATNAAAFERVLRDMLDNHPDLYGQHGPAIMALLAHWHPPAAPPQLDGILDQLAKQRVFIKLDPHGHGLLVANGDLTPGALADLAAYVRQALLDPDRTPSVPGVVCDALSQLGVVVNIQGAFLIDREFGPAHIRRDIGKLEPHKYRDVARFVRQCTTVLMGGDQHIELIRALAHLCTCLDDPERVNDAAFQQAAQQAMWRHGLIHPWLLSHHPSPENIPPRTVDTLLDCANHITSPSAAIQFVTDLTRYLARLRARAASPQNASSPAEWRQLRLQLLTRAVAAFVPLVQGCTDPLAPSWTALARWVWVTQATLSLLLPGKDHLLLTDSTVHAHCLALFASQGKALRHTLALLCAPESLQPELAPHDAPPTVQQFFTLCAPATRLAVLRLPLPGLWLSIPLLFNLDQFFADHSELPLELQVDQFTHLLPYLEHRMAFEAFANTLPRLLAAPNVKTLIDSLRTRVQAPLWANYLLRAFRQQQEASETVLRPRGLPGLLAWSGQATQLTLLQGDDTLWASWLNFLGECANRENSHEPQEPLSVADWLILGHYLPLSQMERFAKVQLVTLAAERLLSSQARAYLLLGWLRQRFAEAASPSPPGQPTPVVSSKLFMKVAEAAKAAIHDCSDDEKANFRNELKNMYTQYESLRKKRQ